MKRVVSVSLGSAKRDHCAEIELMGETIQIERIGTNGNIQRAINLIKDLDGKVDAFGMGGIDLYLWAGQRKYILRDAIGIQKAAQKTPIVDGSGLKNTLEPRVIEYLYKERIVEFANKKVLITSAMDRFGMAEAIDGKGARLTIGDLIFALKVDCPLYSLKTLNRVAKILAPIACKLPLSMLYPTGKQQDGKIDRKIGSYYQENDIIAGDYHYIRRYMPERLDGKTLITNTVTQLDVEELKAKGVALLVTTTPELEGRSFGTNAMEAAIVALGRNETIKQWPRSYETILEEINLKPRILRLQDFPFLT
ncbi:conserved hypothetical protein [Alkaliphilus metalliredigens QYMF]|uniref:Quinate 5-dehydrogenase n=1 Tax=Alkaliphilus metalliredigens (strain QYMF) TaxID=293826 RepID=A6TWN0_ALKMQ|nr:hypothetical protein [Alkaliphilus metalliredigens]ABR50598.1 conserved hypothetical protein [Alkaliphilus metalliredigens QYMF]